MTTWILLLILGLALAYVLDAPRDGTRTWGIGRIIAAVVGVVALVLVIVQRL